MHDARSICRSLAEMHALLYSLRHTAPTQAKFPGATAFMRPGVDSEFSSSSANRLLVYDPVGVDLVDTVRAGAAALAAAGISHWFLELGAGITLDQVQTLMREFAARPRNQVRYPTFARVPANVPPVKTSLEIHRPDADEVHRRIEEIDAIWSSPGAAAPMASAIKRPETFAPVLGLADGRAVAMGMLVIGNTPGGVSYLSAGGTHADFRNRGGQSAIIAERVRIAHGLARSLCISETVLTVPTSTTNLIKAGFVPVFEWTVLEVGTYTGT